MERGTAQTFRVFVRNWWRWESVPQYGQDVNGRHCIVAKKTTLIPDPGALKTTLARRMTESEARAFCSDYNARHVPGPLSRKAEYEQE